MLGSETPSIPCAETPKSEVPDDFLELLSPVVRKWPRIVGFEIQLSPKFWIKSNLNYESNEPLNIHPFITVDPLRINIKFATKPKRGMPKHLS